MSYKYWITTRNKEKVNSNRLQVSWLSLDILSNPWLHPAIFAYLWLSLAISDYLWLSLTISGYLWLYKATSDYLLLSLSCIKYQDASRSKRVQVIDIWNFFFTDRIYRGARAPKNDQKPCLQMAPIRFVIISVLLLCLS